MQFCGRCGSELGKICPECRFFNPSQFLFCGKCGKKLDETGNTKTSRPETQSERKYATVLFSDLSGYTALSERLDPEKVQELMSRIFGEIAQVVARYEGFIEKIIGDAVMALFGVPKAHEDDPVRAIRAARQIHDAVGAMSPQIEEKFGVRLSMHSGINTGLVVTGKASQWEGAQGVTGDAVNMASRLSDMAEAGEILAGPTTYHLAEKYFDFFALAPADIKGKAGTIQVYRVLSAKKAPLAIRRLAGLRADLIGRKVELSRLKAAFKQLKKGKGGIISICGGAGKGKSRLIHELKSALDQDGIQWVDGHAYAYSRKIPYFPLIDLLNRLWQIEEGDPPGKVREKIEKNIHDLTGKKKDILPYVGSLYAMSYPELEGMSPDLWKSRLQQATKEILLATANKSPTIFCLEDIHWADPSSIDLFRSIMAYFSYSALFICAYRPPFSLFAGHQLKGIGRLHQEIRLEDLSPSEAQDMLESLLETRDIPPALRRFIRDKAEGNPFYLEEVVNSLIELETLSHEKGEWHLTRPISQQEIPPTVQGVISARLDRLGRETKRLLQEASVIGRAFLYDILKGITDLKVDIKRHINDLERLGLIKTQTVMPDLEYVIKHALIQEVGYNGLLVKERLEIHERIAHEMEEVFSDRLSEFCETLAFHYMRGKSIHKAVDYLLQSGEKSLRRYALEESHQYFKEAFELLEKRGEKGGKDKELLIDLLVKWSFVYYYRGDYKGLLRLLTSHKALAESLTDRAKLGMFYAWFGCALWHRETFKEAYQYLTQAVGLGEETANHDVIGYASSWLTWTCTELGLPEEAFSYAKRAQETYRTSEVDPYILFNSLAGMGYAFWHRGQRQKTFETGQTLLEFGREHANLRSKVLGHCCIGWSHLIAGDLPAATSCFRKAVKVSADPWYSQFPKLALSYGYASSGQIEDAEKLIREILGFSRTCGAEFLGAPATMFQAIVFAARGQADEGIKILEQRLRTWREHGSKLRYGECAHFLARVYANIAQSAEPAEPISTKDKERDFPAKKAAVHFAEAIEVAKEIGANGLMGHAYLNWGLLEKSEGGTAKAEECISTAIEILKKCDAHIYLNQAKEALESLQ